MYKKVIRTLAAASAAIIAAPVKLPPKVVTIAKCVALALGVLEAVDGANRNTDAENTEDTGHEIE